MDEQQRVSDAYSALKVEYWELKRNTGDYTELVRKHEVLKDAHKRLQNAYNQKKYIGENLQRENERLAKRVKELQQNTVEQNPNESPAIKRKKQLEKYANLYGESVRANDRLREEIRQLKQQLKQ